MTHRAYRLAVLTLVLAASACAAPPAPAVVLPAEQPLQFSNVRVTEGEDPHAYGLEVEVFTRDGRWTGFVSDYGGPVADPPVARMSDLSVDDRTGQMVFTATLTVGVTTAPGSTEWVPARDRYDFTGTIAAEAVSGALVKTRVEPPHPGPAREDIVLVRKYPDYVPPDLTYETWLANWEAVLRFRNPKG